jgi:nodulation protein A
VSAPAEVSWAPISWSETWEDDVTPDEHAALAVLFARCFPYSRTPFTGFRSWSSGRPELRLIGRDGPRIVAHLGILRRFVRAGEASLLLGDVGLVAADPSVQGNGVGAELLARAATTLRGLGMPFGFLTCGEAVAAFYERGGWVRVPNPTRMVRADGQVQVYDGASMVLPVCSPMEDWPEGEKIDRNGLEV